MQVIHLSAASTQESQIIQEGLTDYNILRIASLPRTTIQKWDFVLKDAKGNLIGGINAEYVNWGILFISLLFVFENYRGLGLGARLLQHVEQLAKTQGGHLAHTDTLDFQGREFYLKQGYDVFGILEDCPRGHKRYYLKKTLSK